MKIRQVLANFLSPLADLDGRAVEDLEALALEVPPIELRRGEILMRQGDPAESIYFVLSGRFSVMVEGIEEPIGEIAQGQPIGEIGFFAKLPRTATVVAMRDSTVLSISHERFERICQILPGLRDGITAEIARRFSQSRRARASPTAIRTIVIVPAGGSRLCKPFADALRTVFAARGRTQLLTTSDIAARFDRTSPDSSAVSRWMNSLEHTAEQIIYVADQELTEATKICIRQADIVLLVAAQNASSELNAAELFAFSVHGRTGRRLVLIHERRKLVASGTSSWLASRDVFMHHHVSMEDLADIERLYRFLSCGAIGLVAGGGGALGVAHLGAYKALRLSGIEFDILGGTSAGAAMMAGLACTDDAERVNAGTHNVFVKSRAFRRLTWPRFGLIDHKAFDRALQSEYKDILVEDLWKPFFAVSCDLGDQKPRIHRRGLLWQAVRASGSIPGILPPFFTKEGEMLVDGAIVENIPLESMKALKAGPNVVLALNTRFPKTYPVDYDSIPGRRELAMALLNPFSRSLPEVPNPLQVIILSMLANGQKDLQLGEADILIEPDLPPSLNLMSWDRHDDIFQNAYRDVTACIRTKLAANDPKLSVILGPRQTVRSD